MTPKDAEDLIAQIRKEGYRRIMRMDIPNDRFFYGLMMQLESRFPDLIAINARRRARHRIRLMKISTAAVGHSAIGLIQAVSAGEMVKTGDSWLTHALVQSVWVALQALLAWFNGRGELGKVPDLSKRK